VAKGDFFLLACDGVWDVMSNEDVCNYITQQRTTESDLNKVANNLANEAIKRGSEDNITVVIVYIE
jgi:serine/threonine protein phosphatase PrpC